MRNSDTRAITTWIGWATGDVDSMHNYKEEFANYLSERRKEDNRIDLTNYPNVQSLKIDFFSDEHEIEDLNNWLDWIKERLNPYKDKLSQWSFSISSSKLKYERGDLPSWKIEFKESISDRFPTLIQQWNEGKFLDVLNDSNSLLWWNN